MDCPRCGLALERDTYEGIEVDVCRACWGFWLERGDLEEIILSRKLVFSPDEIRAVVDGRTARDRGPIEPGHCPQCSARMERVYLDPALWLVIDRCKQHGIWLDAGEVKLIQAIAEQSAAAQEELMRKIRGIEEVR